jgi:hypothetical protein
VRRPPADEAPSELEPTEEPTEEPEAVDGVPTPDTAETEETVEVPAGPSEEGESAAS